MKLTDPVADMLTRIRNALRARHQKVDVPASKLKLEIARILKEEGYVSNFKPTEEEGHKVIRIYLKYDNNNEGVCAPYRDSSRAGWVRDQHSHHAPRRDDRTPGAQAGLGRRASVRSLVVPRCAASNEPRAKSIGCSPLGARRVNARANS